MTFEEYVHSRGAALVRFARLLTGDDHRADDLVQEVLAKAYVQWRRVVAADRPDIYVRRMLVNANSSWWRRRSNRELSVAEIVDHPGDRDLGADAVERDLMWRLMARLPPRQRAVLVLRYYEDLDDASVAEILDCSPVTVRTTALRAVATLRERYRASESIVGANRD
ncbi:SigE family RNA polymerase sigma factor [Micromonospora sp. WMMD1102]|uniref:SigE family RNA polymerase sigma factor n=1 Tax=Micromonospora sp. WMMD1102 TaxID=3016105 RepID=UPI002415441C|nr:SigE family RNA polymerase sigma factor [Micromonospora sp. WMMD1102]MDG4786367.1 SigE family RNA polymerase sigma factor [Micromonospora sp. WMMD1102]